MAIYRNVFTNFWTDTKVEEMSKDERYFFIYLLTNPYTSLAGCYELSLSKASAETDLSKDRIKQLIGLLTKRGIVKYDAETKEVLLLNWYKYNWTASEKLHKRIVDEIPKIKSKALFSDTVSIAYTYGIDTASIRYGYGMDTVRTRVSDCDYDYYTTDIINNPDNKQESNITTAPACVCEGYSVFDIANICQIECPVVYNRHVNKPNADYNLGQILDEIQQTMTLEQIRQLLAKANRTYVAQPKYNTLDLLWVLNNAQKVMGAEDITVSAVLQEPPPRFNKFTDKLIKIISEEENPDDENNT